jgi:putative membrane protein
MYIKQRYSFWMTANWSKKPFIYGLLYSFAVGSLYIFLSDKYGVHISLPWQPVSVIGIAVSFYLGFKNNSSYDRTWEARKIWGSLVNNSRTFGAAVCAFVRGKNDEDIRKELIYRHLAWLTALRYQLRLSREWEHTEDRLKGKYNPTISEEYFEKLDKEIIQFIPEEEFQIYTRKSNVATQILHRQSLRLQELRDQNFFDDFRHMRLHDLIRSFYEDQGKSERIKNFPFPRQYASVAYWITVIFCIVVPFGMLDIFMDVHGSFRWMYVFLSGLVIWIFFLMELIGDYSENPFEGTYNDVPISSIARTIEIDLREMIQDTNIPLPLKDENGFLM